MCEKRTSESNGVSQIGLLEAKIYKEYMVSYLNNSKYRTDRPT